MQCRGHRASKQSLYSTFRVRSDTGFKHSKKGVLLPGALFLVAATTHIRHIRPRREPAQALNLLAARSPDYDSSSWWCIGAADSPPVGVASCRHYTCLQRGRAVDRRCCNGVSWRDVLVRRIAGRRRRRHRDYHGRLVQDEQCGRLYEGLGLSLLQDEKHPTVEAPARLYRTCPSPCADSDSDPHDCCSGTNHRDGKCATLHHSSFCRRRSSWDRHRHRQVMH